MRLRCLRYPGTHVRYFWRVYVLGARCECGQRVRSKAHRAEWENYLGNGWEEGHDG